MASDHVEDMDVSIYKSDEDLAATEVYHNYPKELLEFGHALCVIFVLIGVPANLITIIALAACRKFRNATAIFIINLHIAHLLFCCVVLPVTAVTLWSKRWVLGRTMCNVYPLMKYALNCTAHFTVVAITINRYIIICHPQVYPRIYKKKILIISLISTWVVAFSLFLPSFFGVWGRFDLDEKGGECTMVPDKNNVCPKMFFLILAFVGPYTIFTVCYSQIWWKVRKTTKKQAGHNVKVMQPPMNSLVSDPSTAEKGIAGPEPSPYEISTDDDSNSSNSPTALTPDNTIGTFFRNLKGTENTEVAHLPTRKDKKLATMIVAIMVSFTLCHLPIMLSRVLYGEYKSHPIANVLVHLMEYATVVLNPIIYVIMSSEYRQVYVSLNDGIKRLFFKK